MNWNIKSNQTSVHSLCFLLSLNSHQDVLCNSKRCKISSTPTQSLWVISQQSSSECKLLFMFYADFLLSLHIFYRKVTLIKQLCCRNDYSLSHQKLNFQRNFHWTLLEKRVFLYLKVTRLFSSLTLCKTLEILFLNCSENNVSQTNDLTQSTLTWTLSNFDSSFLCLKAMKQGRDDCNRMLITSRQMKFESFLAARTSFSCRNTFIE